MIKEYRNRIKHTSPSTKALLVFIFFVILVIFIPIVKPGTDVSGILSAAAIFYSILLGFYIAAAMGNLSRLKTLVSIETGALIAIYYIVKLSLPGKLDKTRDAIDKYVMKRFEYEVHDYTEPTTEEFFAIFDVLKGADTKTEGEGAAIDYIAEAMYYVPQARRELTIVGAKIVNKVSWVVLITLSIVIVFCLFLTRDSSVASSIVTALLSSSAIFGLFILSDIDGNRFGEDQFAINTYQDVFAAIGELHYYPKLYLDNGRYKPYVEKYRTGSYQDVKVVDNKKQRV
ncbi:MAG TPA: hypothetical protein VMR16_00090 [Candidatus Saccharimonadales bacterium]|nr:hypothetical protein [Candidatus Saccharimonadales bacterium]